MLESSCEVRGQSLKKRTDTHPSWHRSPKHANSGWLLWLFSLDLTPSSSFWCGIACKTSTFWSWVDIRCVQWTCSSSLRGEIDTLRVSLTSCRFTLGIGMAAAGLLLPTRSNQCKINLHRDLHPLHDRTASLAKQDIVAPFRVNLRVFT